MNDQTNLVRIRVVASALAELNERVIFVGGATVSLYVTDSAAAEPRPTDDIDVVVEVTTYAEFVNRIEERLRQLGFTNDIGSSVICRYKIHGLTVDLMPADSNALGFSNRWYPEGIANSILYPLTDRQSIRILTAPYFIATKFEAFNSFRHGQDPRMNTDFEDIIYLFDTRHELSDEISQCPVLVRSYLQAEITSLLANPNTYENIYAQLEPRTASKRTERILNIWRRIVQP